VSSSAIFLDPRDLVLGGVETWSISQEWLMDCLACARRFIVCHSFFRSVKSPLFRHICSVRCEHRNELKEDYFNAATIPGLLRSTWRHVCNVVTCVQWCYRGKIKQTPQPFGYFATLLWPWPWLHDLDTRPSPRYYEDVPTKTTFLDQGF